MTYVKSEPVYLPVWLRHYSQHFPLANMYVLNTGGNATIPAEFTGVNMFSSCRCGAYHNLDCLNDIVEDVHGQLLQRYKYVLVVDVDELLYAPGGLWAYLERQTAPHIKAISLSIIHNVTEAPMNWDVDVLRQRRYYFRYRMYDKPVVHSAPVEWNWGIHRAYVTDEVGSKCFLLRRIDYQLFLVHLNRADFDYCMLRERWKANQTLARGHAFVTNRSTWLPLYCRSTNRMSSPRVVHRVPRGFEALGDAKMEWGKHFIGKLKLPQR
jgi:hypothetical protein